MSGASTIRRVEELAGLISSACEDVAPQIAAMAGDPTAVLVRIVHRVQERCRRILAQACG